MARTPAAVRMRARSGEIPRFTPEPLHNTCRGRGIREPLLLPVAPHGDAKPRGASRVPGPSIHRRLRTDSIPDGPRQSDATLVSRPVHPMNGRGPWPHRSAPKPGPIGPRTPVDHPRAEPFQAWLGRRDKGLLIAIIAPSAGFGVAPIRPPTRTDRRAGNSWPRTTRQSCSTAESPTRLGYSAKDIEVLEGLEPVRKRPGMYIGGTDERAYHHLFAEVLDNAIDEAVAGHASRIDVTLDKDGMLSVRDDGRGIPIGIHPKFKNKTALEVIMTMLHSGGKFSNKAYETAGGLHGVGISVVNALSDMVEVEVAIDRKLYRQTYSRGKPTSKLSDRRRSAQPARHADQLPSRSADLRRQAALPALAPVRHGALEGLSQPRRRNPLELRSQAAEGRRQDAGGSDAALSQRPRRHDEAELTEGATLVLPEAFTGRVEIDGGGAVEWAVVWSANGFGEADGFSRSYCNTIPTPEGGTHEAGHALGARPRACAPTAR